MKLRTTLVLVFLGLSLIQVAAVVPFALKNLKELLLRQESSRVQRSMLAVDAATDRLRDDIKAAVDELSQSQELETVLREFEPNTPPPATVTELAQHWMTARGLTVLSLLDSEGRTLSNGHLPAKLGDIDETLFQVTQLAPDTIAAVTVELSAEGGLHTIPALVLARPVDYGESRFWVVGGRQLDEKLARELSRLTGADVRIVLGHETLFESGTPANEVTARVMEFPPVAKIELRFSREEMLATQEEVRNAFLALLTLGVTFALLLGWLLSRRITRPLEALTEAASRIGSGEFGAKVELKTGRELSTLIDTFNRMTSDLQDTTQRLVQSERTAAWQEVAKRLAHEIKNPLTPIKMSLETLVALNQRQDPRFGPLFQQSAGAVLEEVERLKRTVDEFSQFARMPKPIFAPVNLSELIRSILALHPDEKIRFQVQLQQGLTLNADKDQLTQVLHNLFKNAIESMADVGGELTVRAVQENEWIRVTVADTGPGIPPNLRASVFEPYVTTKTGGSGLGLPIAARIAQEHGGNLELIDSAVGACFRLSLPT